MTTVTAADIFQRAARIMGARVGTLGTVAVGASTTTAVLNGLKNTTGDNMGFPGGDRLMVKHAATGIYEEALVRSWVDATGVATFLNMGTAPVANDTYMVWNREDYSLNEIRYAFDKALNETPRTYRQVIPFTPLLREYPFDAFTLNGAGDIDAVFSTISPLMLHNEDMSLWQNGPDAAPDGYVLSGSGATIERVSGGVRSNYAALVTAGGGATARLTQAIPTSLDQWITRRTYPVFYPVRSAGWVSTTDASSVRVGISYALNGSTTEVYSDYIDDDGVPHFPEVSLTPTEGMNSFAWFVEVAAGDACRVSFAGFMQNTIPFSQAFQIKDSGSQAAGYQEREETFAVRNKGGLPYIELPGFPATWGQLIVYVRRPFPAFGDDADTFDEQYARVLVAGLLNFLLEAVKPNQDRSRLDRIRAAEAGIWTRMSTNIVDLPVPNPPGQPVIQGW